MTAKFKITTNTTSTGEKKFMFTPKAVEMTTMKVFASGEEQPMEQMMIQSMVNIQLEQVKKVFKEIPAKVGSIVSKMPKELQCFGFKISDLDLSFKKSQLQFTAYQKEVSEPDEQYCDNFYRILNDSNEEVLKTIREGASEHLGKGFKTITDAQKKTLEDKNQKPEAVKEDL